MKNKLFLSLFGLISCTLFLYSCYPEETDLTEVTEIEMPIDTIQISQGVSKFVIDETEYSREGFAQYCDLIDEITGDMTTQVLINNGTPYFSTNLFGFYENDVAIIERGNPLVRTIFVAHSTETEGNFYRSDGEDNQLIFTEVTDTTLRGTWEGNFKRRIGEDIWEEGVVISGEFFVPVLEGNCE